MKNRSPVFRIKSIAGENPPAASALGATKQPTPHCPATVPGHSTYLTITLAL
ncbi:MAG: hypothetical protein LBV12_09300 [Puniceicoccales bacterium]|nr:hypothetical protein [Puniceicoccales bacterium]